MFQNLIQNEIFQISHLSGFALFGLKFTGFLLLGLLLHCISRGLFKSFSRVLQKKSAHWADLVLQSAYRPGLALIWFLIGLALLHLLLKTLGNFLEANGLNYLFEMGILMVCVWFCLGLLRRICDHWSLEAQKVDQQGQLMLDQTSILVIRRAALIGLTLFAVLIALGIFNIPLSGLLTFGGISGAALAFASQSMIANFFGGLFIYFDRPFVIGDWISSSEKNFEGYVEHIGWRLTLIRSLDKRPIYVPNSVFTSSIIENPSRMTYRRINQNITLCYDDAEKMALIMEKTREILKNENLIDHPQSLVSLASRDALNSSGITFNISAYSKVTNSAKFKALQDRILLQVEAMIRGLEGKISTFTH